MKKRAPDYQKERGERQEQRIIECLMAGPKTVTTLAALLAMSRCNAEIYMRRMHKADRIHIATYEKRTGRPAPVWAVGQKTDAEYVPNRRPSPVRTVAERVEQVKELLKAGHTSRELAEKLCVTRGRAQHYVQLLRKAGNVSVRIIGWRHPGHRGDLAPIYRIGCGEDAPKPRETRAQRYAKEKANPEKYERILRKRRVRHLVDMAKKRPNGIFGALGI
jgi:DNA-binding CsgD family transcriptional regulator